MKYSIAFQGLPFEPEKRQVIYVENQYDERINKLIKDNYQQIKWIFERARLEFIYLPMFFNDEEIKEKVLYYAPYLTSEILEQAEMRSSFLLGYMSHLENKEKIEPSFIYTPKKEENEWIFQGRLIPKDINLKAFIQWIEDIVSEIEEDMSVSSHEEIGLKYERRDREEPKCPPALDSVDINEGDVSTSHSEHSSTPSFWEQALKGLKTFGKKCVEEEDYIESSKETAPSSLDDIREEDIRDTIEELVVAKYETISRLRITDDYEIFLPDYGNREVKMGALYKAIYFLFLNHPEGIILKHLEDYHNELVNYYLQTSHKETLSKRMAETIYNLEYPGNNDINTDLSRIKAYFKSVVDEHLAKHYCIVGKPGEPYKIALDYDLIEWEESK